MTRNLSTKVQRVTTQASSPPTTHIYVIDDDAAMRDMLGDFLAGEGFGVVTFANADDALAALRKAPESVDVVVSDIRMPRTNGLELVQSIKSAYPSLPVILITAFGSVESAIDAMRHGARDYLVKPFKLAELLVKIERMLDHRRLALENQALRGQLVQTWRLEKMIGKSALMRELFDLINRVAQANANVLITGESGTGKEMVARAVHGLGPRAAKPFVAIDCTAIPENLLESELFGHTRGSFTGATANKRGLFEEADGGTVFLDEIGDLDLTLQAKILRVIQERTIRAVGANATRPVDIRIVAATHKDLKAAVRAGRFREDLFFRLSVIPLTVPALRHRVEDIPILAEHFLAKFAARNGGHVRGFSPEAFGILMAASWPGNIRELENTIERAVILATGPLIARTDLAHLQERTVEEFYAAAATDLPSLSQLEERYIKFVLEKVGSRKERAAQILGVNRRTLYRKEREFGWVDDGDPECDEEAHSSEVATRENKRR